MTSGWAAFTALTTAVSAATEPARMSCGSTAALPVDADIALLLASDLVTNAILHQVDGTITLVLTSSPGQLRVDVYGTPVHLPPYGPLPYEVPNGRGLALVRTLADQWGWYVTPMGRAVYFTLEFPLQP